MIRGSIAAIVTPMDSDGKLHYESLSRLIDYHLAEGTHGLVVAGTTGEGATLAFREHVALIERTVEMVRGQIPVIAGTGSNCTREAIELTRAAKQAGADACLLITPYYVRPTQEGLYRHFQTIADAIAIPQILYNVPARTCCDLLPETVSRLSQHGNIVGIKDATGDLHRAQQLIEIGDGRFAVYSGDDASALELMLMGGAGNISVTANVAPRLVADMCSAAGRGEALVAKSLDNQLRDLTAALFVEANPIPVKWALNCMGLIPDGIRLPLTWLSEENESSLSEALINTFASSTL